MTRDAIRSAYDARAEEYAAHFAAIDAAHPDDAAAIRRWADTCAGDIVDAGCGPGHWTDYLRSLGSSISGFDLSPKAIRIARTRFPLTAFRVASLEHTGLADGSLGGILSWFSLIHTDPNHADAALDEFARVLRPGGRILIGAFSWPILEPFPHAVVTAYRWPPQVLCARVEAAGFRIDDCAERREPGSRPKLRISATACHGRGSASRFTAAD